MKNPLISAIFPCYNVANYLPDLFASLEQFDYPNIEFIFVNDGSKDNTLQLLQEFCKDKDNCIIVDQENQKLCMARNNGLAKAKGEYIWFCDPDDIPSPYILTYLYRNMVEHNADISICNYKKVKENFHFSDCKKASDCNKIKFYDQESAMCQYFSCKKFDLNVWSKLYKNDILKKFESYPNVFDKKVIYGEDVDFNSKYLMFCKKCVYTTTNLYYYRQRKSSIVHSKFNESRLTTFIGINNAIKRYEGKYPQAQKYIKSLKGLVSIEMLYYIYKSEYSDKQTIEDLLYNLKSNMKYIVSCKRNHLYRRIFVPLTYPLFKLFLANRMRKNSK